MSLPYHETLTTVPDFTKDPTRRILFAQDLRSVSAAPRTAAFPQNRPDHIFTFQFLLDSSAEIRDLQKFFTRQLGSTKAFWFPTWSDDIAWVAGPIGSVTVPVGTDYQAEHLDDTPGDHWGRQLFVWHPVHGFHTSRILRAVENMDGSERLDLEFPLTFLPDAKTIIGWCHLCRFANEQLDWQYSSPTVANTEVQIRSAYAANSIEQTNDLTHVGYGDITLPFASVAQTVAATDPPNQRTAYSFGPTNLHYPDGVEYVVRWAAWITPDQKIKLRKLPLPDYIWLPESLGTPSGLFATVPTTLDHLTLAFDQNGFEVIGWQKDPATIQIKRYVSGSVTTHEFAGTDPILYWNWLLDPLASVGDSDVVCYYLNAKGQLCLRVQRDNFGVEYVLGELPFVPLGLRRAYHADIEVEGTPRRFLYLECLDAAWRNATLISEAYPEPPPPPPPDPTIICDAPPEFSRTALTFTATYSHATVYADGLPFDALYHTPFVDPPRTALAYTVLYENTVIYADGLPLNDPTHPPFTERPTTSLSYTGVYELTVLSPANQADRGTSALTVSALDYTLSAIENYFLAETSQTSTTVTNIIYEP